MIMYDTNGVTGESYRNLAKLVEFKDLEKIFISGHGTSNIQVTFAFTDTTCYSASGFSIGYGGEGPRGLYRAMELFINNLPSWEDIGIFKLDPEKNWTWSGEEFVQTEIINI